MFRITKDGTAIGMTEAPNYIKLQKNGCYVLCPEEEATGIAFNGTAYHLLGREALEGAADVVLEKVDAGIELGTAVSAATNAINATAITGQVAVASKLYVQASTDISDDSALQMPDLFKTWEEVLAAGKKLEQGTIIKDGGTLYRVVAAEGVTPAEHQPPHGEGLLAIYRPIDTGHAGTKDDPIPFINGMDTEAEKYYSYNGSVYLCNLTMTPCVWPPDTAGLWQWTKVEVEE